MSNHIRPVLLGYIRADVLRADAEDLPVAKSYLEAYAEAEEYTLGTIFVERGHTTTGAFDALIDEVRRNEETWGVVVPDVRHLADAEHRVMRRHREHCSGMSLLVANFSP